MSNPNELYQRRWYDQQPPVQQTVQTILSFSVPLQNYIGGGLLMVVEDRYKVRADDIKALRSISELAGFEAVQALYKASQRQRSWDHVPNLHRAMTFWRMVPENQHRTLVLETLNLCKCVSGYAQTCLDADRDINEHELQGFIQDYIRQGPQRIATLPPATDNIMARAPQNPAPSQPQPPPIIRPARSQGDQVIAEDGDDFRIRLH